MMATKPSKVLMVGDLLLADIVGGKLAGMQTLLVAPVNSTERPGIHALRLLERLLGYHAKDEHSHHKPD
jgi:predicted HAD superfamily phosphohydrolase YqeG